MTQVLIDRELLERCRARLYGLMQADLSTELAALLADHSEQHLEMVEQSVEVVAYRVSLPSDPELGHWFDEHAEEEPQTCWYEPLMTVAQHQRVLADMRQQRDKLAELLREAGGELRTDRHHGLRPKIEAALSELTP